MSDSNTIKINPAKPSSIDFEVMISGLEGITPAVRFVIEGVKDGIDWVVKCKKLDKTKWQASFPSMEEISQDSAEFSVEVIVDEYYFKPAHGIIQFMNTPNVSFEVDSSKSKPKVTTSFTVNQEEKPKKKKPIKEAMGGGEVTGQYAPTNDLLVPEEDPTATQSHVKVAQAELDDQYIDKVRLDDITDEDPIPGQGNQYPQDDGKYDEDDIEPDDEATKFDMDKMVESIIKQSVPLGLNPNSVGAITKKGTLFKRDADGKIIVPGLESKQQKQELADREKKIKDLLK